MSEQAPNPEEHKEPTPLFDDCSNCEKRYQLTPANSAVYHYNKQSECDFLFAVCPHCKQQQRMFCGQDVINLARENGLKVVEDEDYADQNIYRSWLEVNEITLPETYELTDRHEELIRKFGETMLNMPDDLLYDEITDFNQPKPHPQRWI